MRSAGGRSNCASGSTPVVRRERGGLDEKRRPPTPHRRPARRSTVIRVYTNRPPTVKPQTRITGWNPDNPPEVERAFRRGFLVGARRALADPYATGDRLERVLELRYRLDWGGRWTHTRAAWLQGCSHALDIALSHLEAGGSPKDFRDWLDLIERGFSRCCQQTKGRRDVSFQNTRRFGKCNRPETGS